MRPAPHLLNEDRPEFERILDDALIDAPHRPELAAAGQPLLAEQLRTMALSSSAIITAAAAAEYEHYVRLREELRSPGRAYESASERRSPTDTGSAPGPAQTAHFPPDTHPLTGRPVARGHRYAAAVLGVSRQGGGPAHVAVAPQRWSEMSYGSRLLAALLGLRVRPEASARPEASRRAQTTRAFVKSGAGRPLWAQRAAPASVREEAGAGMFAVAAVLIPILSGCAAVLFFLVGLVLKMVHAGSGAARTLISVGWLLSAVAAAALVAAVLLLLLSSAVRSRGQPAWAAAGTQESQANEELNRAREAWQEALRERGIMPFLQQALSDPTPAHSRRDTNTSRIPSLGYHRPGPATPGEGPGSAASPRPSYTSPDFTSPDFGGSDDPPE